jgi:hypothetical protein
MGSRDDRQWRINGWWTEWMRTAWDGKEALIEKEGAANGRRTACLSSCNGVLYVANISSPLLPVIALCFSLSYTLDSPWSTSILGFASSCNIPESFVPGWLPFCCLCTAGPPFPCPHSLVQCILTLATLRTPLYKVY